MTRSSFHMELAATLLLLVVLALPICTLTTTVVVYSESFEGQSGKGVVGTVRNTSGVRWSISAQLQSPGFAVNTNDSFEGGTGKWLTPWVNTESFENVRASISYRSAVPFKLSLADAIHFEYQTSQSYRKRRNTWMTFGHDVRPNNDLQIGMGAMPSDDSVAWRLRVSIFTQDAGRILFDNVKILGTPRQELHVWDFTNEVRCGLQKNGTILNSTEWSVQVQQRDVGQAQFGVAVFNRTLTLNDPTATTTDEFSMPPRIIAFLSEHIQTVAIWKSALVLAPTSFTYKKIGISFGSLSPFPQLNPSYNGLPFFKIYVETALGATIPIFSTPTTSSRNGPGGQPVPRNCANYCAQLESNFSELPHMLATDSLCFCPHMRIPPVEIQALSFRICIAIRANMPIWFDDIVVSGVPPDLVLSTPMPTDSNGGNLSVSTSVAPSTGLPAAFSNKMYLPVDFDLVAGTTEQRSDLRSATATALVGVGVAAEDIVEILIQPGSVATTVIFASEAARNRARSAVVKTGLRVTLSSGQQYVYVSGDCEWKWSEWGPCSVACGDGEQIRTPVILVAAINGQCNLSPQSKYCNIGPCTGGNATPKSETPTVDTTAASTIASTTSNGTGHNAAVTSTALPTVNVDISSTGASTTSAATTTTTDTTTTTGLPLPSSTARPLSSSNSPTSNTAAIVGATAAVVVLVAIVVLSATFWRTRHRSVLLASSSPTGSDTKLGGDEHGVSFSNPMFNATTPLPSNVYSSPDVLNDSVLLAFDEPDIIQGGSPR